MHNVSRNLLFYVGAGMLLLWFVLRISLPDTEGIRAVITPATGIPVQRGVQSQVAPAMPEAFTLKDFKGKPYALDDASMRGKNVVVAFFADWCSECHSNLVMMQGFASKYSDEVKVIGVHVTSTEHKSRGEQMARDVGATFKILSDVSGAVYEHYAKGQRTLPLTLVLNRDHVLQKVLTGQKQEKQLNDVIAAFGN